MEYLQENISTRPEPRRYIWAIIDKYGLGMNCPVAKDAYEYSVALPLHNCMQAEDYEYS